MKFHDHQHANEDAWRTLKTFTGAALGFQIDGAKQYTTSYFHIFNFTVFRQNWNQTLPVKVMCPRLHPLHHPNAAPDL